MNGMKVIFSVFISHTVEKFSLFGHNSTLPCQAVGERG